MRNAARQTDSVRRNPCTVNWGRRKPGPAARRVPLRPLRVNPAAAAVRAWGAGRRSPGRWGRVLPIPLPQELGERRQGSSPTAAANRLVREESGPRRGPGATRGVRHFPATTFCDWAKYNQSTPKLITGWSPSSGGRRRVPRCGGASGGRSPPPRYAAPPVRDTASGRDGVSS